MSERGLRLTRRAFLRAGLAGVPAALLGVRGGLAQPQYFQQPPEGVDVTEETVVYRHASGEDLTLTLYVPGRASAAAPAVVFFHGGGWLLRVPRSVAPLAQAFAARGYVAAAATYRLSDLAPFPAAVADAKAAVRWLRAHAGEYGIDRDLIAAAGESAGGQLAAMVATTPGLWEDGEDLDQSSAVQAAMLLSGDGLDFRDPDLFREREIAGGPGIQYLGGTIDQIPDVYELASPIVHVSAATPPTLLLHGTADRTVPYAQAVAFRDALTEAGGVAELFTAEGAEHGFYRRSPTTWLELTVHAMLDFTERNLGPPPARWPDAWTGGSRSW